jgi:hypothetical protein
MAYALQLLDVSNKPQAGLRPIFILVIHHFIKKNGRAAPEGQHLMYIQVARAQPGSNGSRC